MNLHISPPSSLDNRYIFSFLGTNSFFSIVWSHIFLIGILSLTFFLKMWIHSWNLGETNFLASSSKFAASSSSFQISHSSAIFFTSIILFFFFLSLSSTPSLLVSFPLPLFSLLSFVFTTMIFPTFASTVFHTLLSTLSSSPLLFSNQFQDYSKLAIAFLKLHSTSNLQSCQSPFSPCILDNKYSLQLYTQ